MTLSSGILVGRYDEAAPENKLGWDNATVNRKQMLDLAALGYREARKIFRRLLP